MQMRPDTEYPERSALAAAVRWPVYLVGAWALLTALFWVLSPSASAGLSAVLRLVFWAVHVGLSLALLQFAQSSIVRFAPGLDRWVSIALAGLAGGALFVPVAFWLDRVFPDPDGPDPGGLAGLASEAAAIMPPVLLVWLGLNAPRLLRIGATQASPRLTPAPAFWEKVPPEIGRDLVSLSAELHYLRVRTTSGDALILYPFGQAVAELSDADGLQVHRSHWAALEHVEGLERRGDGGSLTMSTGDAIPVSRRYRKETAEALGAFRAG